MYFVLGNEDFFDSSIATVREQVNQLCNRHPTLHYLSADCEPVELTTSVALIGHDGWPDGRFAKLDMPGSTWPEDYARIRELREADEKGRWGLLNTLGDQAAEHFRGLLSNAVRQFNLVLLLTHVPPWLELAPHPMHRKYYRDTSHYCASRAAGDAIRAVMEGAPNCQLIVLSSHPHGAAEFRPLPNVVAYSASPKFAEPSVQKVIDLPEAREELGNDFFR